MHPIFYLIWPQPEFTVIKTLPAATGELGKEKGRPLQHQRSEGHKAEFMMGFTMAGSLAAWSI